MSILIVFSLFKKLKIDNIPEGKLDELIDTITENKWLISKGTYYNTDRIKYIKIHD